MIPFVFQESVQITSSELVYTQPEAGWVGTGLLQDVVLQAHVRALTTGVGVALTLDIETASEREEELFVPMVTGVALAVGVTNIKALLASADVPVLRWMRWKLTLGGGQPPWFINFRILGCGNPVGGAR